ncbi:uncharacterized protein AMSG_10161 [Thecamonas trahens ATCC 50062]|uniref:WW domain-containing protein n=1 Tax=Thecamonas trahens ATCC 50062 TaxID=461836 RepID=A0A0L0DSJ9_THETB|nr:hypothetical protein AMSG_10161 [Thecamonas trahens ATCC 50062]KNC54428.1 hypothetical protein AMSG_10161 [Thecamonas trahens ATCC 50062]|eukprot:XP_013753723.1 hypothetical protein AMSG_10161 [Thecamonas trahens ATCC 50062]
MALVALRGTLASLEDDLASFASPGRRSKETADNHSPTSAKARDAARMAKRSTLAVPASFRLTLPSSASDSDSSSDGHISRSRSPSASHSSSSSSSSSSPTPSSSSSPPHHSGLAVVVSTSGSETKLADPSPVPNTRAIADLVAARKTGRSSRIVTTSGPTGAADAVVAARAAHSQSTESRAARLARLRRVRDGESVQDDTSSPRPLTREERLARLRARRNPSTANAQRNDSASGSSTLSSAELAKLPRAERLKLLRQRRGGRPQATPAEPPFPKVNVVPATPAIQSSDFPAPEAISPPLTPSSSSASPPSSPSSPSPPPKPAAAPHQSPVSPHKLHLRRRTARQPHAAGTHGPTDSDAPVSYPELRAQPSNDIVAQSIAANFDASVIRLDDVLNSSIPFVSLSPAALDTAIVASELRADKPPEPIDRTQSARLTEHLGDPDLAAASKPLDANHWHVDVPLPAGWQRQVDLASFSCFYTDAASGTTTTTHPSLMPPVTQPDTDDRHVIQLALFSSRSGWARYLDPQTNLYFYYCARTGETSWLAPADAVVAIESNPPVMIPHVPAPSSPSQPALASLAVAREWIATFARPSRAVPALARTPLPAMFLLRTKPFVFTVSETGEPETARAPPLLSLASTSPHLTWDLGRGKPARPALAGLIADPDVPATSNRLRQLPSVPDCSPVWEGYMRHMNASPMPSIAAASIYRDNFVRMLPGWRPFALGPVPSPEPMSLMATLVSSRPLGASFLTALDRVSALLDLPPSPGKLRLKIALWDDRDVRISNDYNISLDALVNPSQVSPASVQPLVDPAPSSEQLAALARAQLVHPHYHHSHTSAEHALAPGLEDVPLHPLDDSIIATKALYLTVFLFRGLFPLARVKIPLQLRPTSPNALLNALATSAGGAGLAALFDAPVGDHAASTDPIGLAAALEAQFGPVPPRQPSSGFEESASENPLLPTTVVVPHRKVNVTVALQAIMPDVYAHLSDEALFVPLEFHFTLVPSPPQLPTPVITPEVAAAGIDIPAHGTLQLGALARSLLPTKVMDKALAAAARAMEAGSVVPTSAALEGVVLEDCCEVVSYYPTSSMALETDDVIPPHVRNNLYVTLHMKTMMSLVLQSGDIDIPQVFWITCALLDGSGAPFRAVARDSAADGTFNRSASSLAHGVGSTAAIDGASRWVIVGSYPVTRATREANHMIEFDIPSVSLADFSAHLLFRFVAPSSSASAAPAGEPMPGSTTFAYAFLNLYAGEGKMRSDNEYELVVYPGSPPAPSPHRMWQGAPHRTDLTPACAHALQEEPTTTVPYYLGVPPPGAPSGSVATGWSTPLMLAVHVVSGEVLDDANVHFLLEPEIGPGQLATLVASGGRLLHNASPFDLYKFHGFLTYRINEFYDLATNSGAHPAEPRALTALFAVFHSLVLAMTLPHAASEALQDSFVSFVWECLDPAFLRAYLDAKLALVCQGARPASPVQPLAQPSSDAGTAAPEWHSAATVIGYMITLGASLAAAPSQAPHFANELDASYWATLASSFGHGLANSVWRADHRHLAAAQLAELSTAVGAASRMYPGVLAVLPASEVAALWRELLPTSLVVPEDHGAPGDLQVERLNGLHAVLEAIAHGYALSKFDSLAPHEFAVQALLLHDVIGLVSEFLHSASTHLLVLTLAPLADVVAALGAGFSANLNERVACVAASPSAEPRATAGVISDLGTLLAALSVAIFRLASSTSVVMADAHWLSSVGLAGSLDALFVATASLVEATVVRLSMSTAASAGPASLFAHFIDGLCSGLEDSRAWRNEVLSGASAVPARVREAWTGAGSRDPSGLAHLGPVVLVELLRLPLRFNSKFAISTPGMAQVTLVGLQLTMFLLANYGQSLMSRSVPGEQAVCLDALVELLVAQVQAAELRVASPSLFGDSLLSAVAFHAEYALAQRTLAHRQEALAGLFALVSQGVLRSRPGLAEQLLAASIQAALALALHVNEAVGSGRPTALGSALHAVFAHLAPVVLDDAAAGAGDDGERLVLPDEWAWLRPGASVAATTEAWLAVVRKLRSVSQAPEMSSWLALLCGYAPVAVRAGGGSWPGFVTDLQRGLQELGARVEAQGAMLEALVAPGAGPELVAHVAYSMVDSILDAPSDVQTRACGGYETLVRLLRHVYLAAGASAAVIGYTLVFEALFVDAAAAEDRVAATARVVDVWRGRVAELPSLSEVPISGARAQAVMVRGASALVTGGHWDAAQRVLRRVTRGFEQQANLALSLQMARWTSACAWRSAHVPRIGGRLFGVVLAGPGWPSTLRDSRHVVRGAWDESVEAFGMRMRSKWASMDVTVVLPAREASSQLSPERGLYVYPLIASQSQVSCKPLVLVPDAVALVSGERTMRGSRSAGTSWVTPLRGVEGASHGFALVSFRSADGESSVDGHLVGPYAGLRTATHQLEYSLGDEPRKVPPEIAFKKRKLVNDPLVIREVWHAARPLPGPSMAVAAASVSQAVVPSSVACVALLEAGRAKLEWLLHLLRPFIEGAGLVGADGAIRGSSPWHGQLASGELGCAQCNRRLAASGPGVVDSVFAPAPRVEGGDGSGSASHVTSLRPGSPGSASALPSFDSLVSSGSSTRGGSKRNGSGGSDLEGKGSSGVLRAAAGAAGSSRLGVSVSSRMRKLGFRGPAFSSVSVRTGTSFSGASPADFVARLSKLPTGSSSTDFGLGSPPTSVGGLGLGASVGGDSTVDVGDEHDLLSEAVAQMEDAMATDGDGESPDPSSRREMGLPLSQFVNAKLAESNGGTALLARGGGAESRVAALKAEAATLLGGEVLRQLNPAGEGVAGVRKAKLVQENYEIHAEYVVDKLKTALRRNWMQENRARQAAGQEKLAAPDLELLRVLPHPEQARVQAAWQAWWELLQQVLVVHALLVSDEASAASEERESGASREQHTALEVLMAEL